MAEKNADMEKLLEVQEEALQTIQSNHDEAHLYVSQAISYEEQNQYELARDMYKRGLEKIDKALNVRCDRPYCTGPAWDKARSMQHKMRKTVQMIRGQLDALNVKFRGSSESSPIDVPPSYVEACEQGPPLSRRASCPNSVLRNSRNSNHQELNGSDTLISEVEEIFTIPDGVQLFYVSPAGTVSTTSASTSLHIYKFLDNAERRVGGTTLPSAWLQVGNWTYPLVPGQSPALESGYGAFIFPDVADEQDASAVGIILPASVDADTRKLFESILDNLTVFEEERLVVSQSVYEPEEPESESFSDTLSRGLVTGAEYLSAGLVKGAAITGEYIHKGAVKLKDRLHPESEPVVVDPRVKQGLKIAKGATNTALKVSGFLVNKLGDLTLSLGRKISPYLKEQGTKVLTNTFNHDPDKAKQTVDNVLKVAAGGVQGFSTVYMGLENAARILAFHLSTETVNIVDHKYGHDAGEVVNNAVYAVGNLALTTRNVQTLGVKSIAKKTAKDAGKAVLQDYAKNIQPGKQEEDKQDKPK